jgi:hypothetical protein
MSTTQSDRFTCVPGLPVYTLIGILKRNPAIKYICTYGINGAILTTNLVELKVYANALKGSFFKEYDYVICEVQAVESIAEPQEIESNDGTYNYQTGD